MAIFCSDYLDITECAIIYFFGVALDKADLHDYRMSICLICKIAIFLIWVLLFLDEFLLSTLNFTMMLFSWLVFGIEILLVEYQYIEGTIKNQEFRATWFKVVDLLQDISLLIYLGLELYHFQKVTVPNIILFMLTLIDGILNLIELLDCNQLNFTRPERILESTRVKNNCLSVFHFWAVAGNALAIYFMVQLLNWSDIHDIHTFPYQLGFLIYVIIGEALQCIFWLVVFVRNCRKNSAPFSKNLIASLEGLTYGFFGIYLSFILTVVLLVFFIFSLCSGGGNKHQQVSSSEEIKS